MEITINLSNFSHNLQQIQLKSNKPLFLVVKNNAYNFGLKQIVENAITDNVTHFCVTALDEAIAIRRISKDAYILLMRPLTESEIRIAKENKIAVMISNFSWFHQYKDMLEGVDLHLKVNVGMNRFGLFEIAEIEHVIIEGNKLNLNITGLMTHFSQADEEDLTEHIEQTRVFADIFKSLQSLGQHFKYIHAENSATLLQQKNLLSFCNYSRVGILAFGYSPKEAIKYLKPVLRVTATVLQIHQLERGEHLGYGTKYTAPKDELIAVLDIGYGDGLIRKRNCLPVYINNRPYDVSGNISMSHMYVAVDNKVAIGDTVEIFGENIPVDALMRTVSTIANSEIISMLHTESAKYGGTNGK